jgi:DNA-binding MarR family transcriptional regulator
MNMRQAQPSEQQPAAEPRELGQVLEFMRALWGIHHELQISSKRMEATTGVTGPQRLVIRIVGRFPSISAGEVSEILRIHPSTLTGVLKRLVAHGLVARQPDPADARRALLTLTPRGKHADAVRVGTIEASLRRALARQPPQAVQATRDVLEALAQELART